LAQVAVDADLDAQLAGLRADPEGPRWLPDSATRRL